MKKLFSFLLFISIASGLSAQNVSINNDGVPPDSTAMLDVQSTGKGFLLPRMTTVQKTAIVSPAKGLLVYQLGTNEGLYINTGSPVAPSWARIDTASKVGFSATTSTSQNFTSLFTKIQFPIEEFDETSSFVPGVASEFTAPFDGLYHFDVSVALQGQANARYDLALFVNGVQKKIFLQMPSSTLFSLAVIADLKLAAGDKVDVRISGQSGGQVVGGSSPWIWFNGHKVY